MGDYESRMFDVQLEIWGLLDRINRRDPALCNCNWRDLTYDYDLDYINYLFQNTNDEEMLDIVKDLICKEHRRLLMEGEIPPHIDEVSGYPDDKFDSFLDVYANNRKGVLAARREEQEARERYAKKLGKGNAKRNSAEDSTTGEDSITEESASKMDWVRLTERFNLDKIKEVVKCTGKSNEEKRIVIKAIFDTLMSVDKLYNVPYAVDKLIIQLYQKYGGQRQDLSPTKDKKTKSKPAKPKIPKEIAETEHWRKLKEAGLVDENGQPTISRTEAAILADVLLEKMGKGHKWKLFEKMWDRKNMRIDFQDAHNMVKYDKVLKKIKAILS